MFQISSYVGNNNLNEKIKVFHYGFSVAVGQALGLRPVPENYFPNKFSRPEEFSSSEASAIDVRFAVDQTVREREASREGFNSSIWRKSFVLGECRENLP
ncbi:hypothetical protein GWI33_006023 [Rhynchophorus ferrugineus]|uniref:Uncharacterized protein n=1 Tax=Rhynchophorus ferrugineus TaxID=354439 RepID=A0A834J3J8_RHYFE|nr:hypothetical protein GWI33_006023 [Rhynchophorus ferrugineus]